MNKNLIPVVASLSATASLVASTPLLVAGLLALIACGPKRYDTVQPATMASGETVVTNGSLWDNCGAQCPDGTKTPVNPVVLQAVLAHPDSLLRASYVGAVAYIRAGAPPSDSPVAMLNMAWPALSNDIRWLAAVQTDFLMEQAGVLPNPDDPSTVAEYSDGELLARAVGRQMAPDVNAMISELGRAQMGWGTTWLKQGESWKTHKYNLTCILAPDQGAQTLTVTCMPKSGGGGGWELRQTHDLSGISGAFDVGADLDYAAVQAAL